ncbi:unnamed protein product, partial [Ectocarpus sp. 13 AM-2016]
SASKSAAPTKKEKRSSVKAIAEESIEEKPAVSSSKKDRRSKQADNKLETFSNEEGGGDWKHKSKKTKVSERETGERDEENKGEKEVDTKSNSKKKKRRSSSSGK